MQIHSLTATHHCSSPTYRLNLDLDIHTIANGRVADLLRAQQESPAGKKPSFSSTNKTSKSPNLACSWRERIQELFDDPLRDAEDLMLSLPYAVIREKTYHFATMLDRLASSDLDGATTRHIPASRISPKTKSNRTGSTVNRQHYDSLVLRKAMCVALAASLIEVNMLTMPSYTCYESLVAVVVSYRQSLGYETEMRARRALTAALAAMESSG
jgi:hypothetical protein